MSSKMFLKKTFYEMLSQTVSEISSLTHWGRVMNICTGNLTIVGSDNGLSPGRCQAITWTNIGIFFIGPLGTNFSEMLNEMHTFSLKNPFENVVCKMAAILSRPQCVKALEDRHSSSTSEIAVWRWESIKLWCVDNTLVHLMCDHAHNCGFIAFVQI